MFLHDAAVTEVNVVEVTDFFQQISSTYLNLGLASVARFHDVDPSLDSIQRRFNCRNARYIFLQHLDRATKKPEFFLFSLVTILGAIVTKDSINAYQCSGCLGSRPFHTIVKQLVTYIVKHRIVRVQRSKRCVRTTIECCQYCMEELAPSFLHMTSEDRFSSLRNITYVTSLSAHELSREKMLQGEREVSEVGRVFSNHRSFLFFLDAMYGKYCMICCHFISMYHIQCKNGLVSRDNSRGAKVEQQSKIITDKRVFITSTHTQDERVPAYAGPILSK